MTSRIVRAAAGIAAIPWLVAAAMMAPVSAQTTGLTGIDHADDVVMARQLLMDGVETEMQTIEIAAAGKELRLGDVKARAETISLLMTAFPHLFPPQTQPVVAADGSPPITAAAPAIWQSFDDFYAKVTAAAMIAFDATRAENEPAFREAVKKLRGACDGCHAQYMRVTAPSP